MDPTPAHDISKLPKWAQRRLAILAAERDRWKARAAAGPTSSDTGAVLGYDAMAQPIMRYFSNGTEVVFTTEGGKLLARVEDGQLRLYAHGAGALVVRPHVTNVIYVEVSRR